MYIQFLLNVQNYYNFHPLIKLEDPYNIYFALSLRQKGAFGPLLCLIIKLNYICRIPIALGIINDE